MALCRCERGPRCQYHHCEQRADWSVYMASTRVAWIREWPYGRFKFFCTRCRDIYVDAVSKPLKGIDRPKWADDEWRGSIMEHVRHARLDIAFEERDKNLGQRAQQLDMFRHLLRKFGKYS